MARDDKFCAICGTPFMPPQPMPIDPNKKRLTKAIIDKELHNQKHSFWEYLGQAALVGLMILIVNLGRPAILLCAIPLALNVINMIRHDIKRSALKYYILERPCIEKKFVEGDESPDDWQLWFNNRNGELNVALSVTQEFHDATELGEEFYVVFMERDKLPSLCYRKSEWVY